MLDDDEGLDDMNEVVDDENEVLREGDEMLQLAEAEVEAEGNAHIDEIEHLE